jgi:DNA modification methylase
VTAYANCCIIGDCRDSMRQMIADGVRVQMCVTSPPYFNLRDYGAAGQIGLEESPGEYVAALVEVFGLVRDLLSDDGTLWLNIGDCYAGSWGAQSRGAPISDRSTLQGNGHTGGGPKIHALSVNQALAAPRRTRTGSLRDDWGLKPKDLMMIPARLAIALQADGWWVRQDIVWSKPNPMPESVTDRCTKAHEYLFLLSKSERYYFDAGAIQEKATQDERREIFRGGAYVNGSTFDNSQGGRASVVGNIRMQPEYRNRRSVWTIATQPYSEAHFATFPPALVAPCILAGSRTGDVVLDPFFGSGTVGEIAQRLGRQWIGCDLQEAYAPLQARRTAQQGFEY